MHYMIIPSTDIPINKLYITVLVLVESNCISKNYGYIQSVVYIKQIKKECKSVYIVVPLRELNLSMSSV